MVYITLLFGLNPNFVRRKTKPHLTRKKIAKSFVYMSFPQLSSRASTRSYIYPGLYYPIVRLLEQVCSQNQVHT